MYTEYFGLKEEPFSIAANPRFLYMSARHREALAHLLYGIRSDSGFVLLTGEVGTGKTTVCRCLLEQLPENTDVAFILNPKVSVKELLSSICDELGAVYPHLECSIKNYVDVISAHLLECHSQGRNTVVIIDEAQNLSVDVLEQLRLLTNLETNERKLLRIILIGQPELEAMLARPELRQVQQRITARYHLQPLLRTEIGAYVSHRLAVAGRKEPLFSAHVLTKLYRKTRGIPRLINIVCDRAMLGAYVKSRRTVNGSIFNEAAKEVHARSGLAAWKLPRAALASAFLVGVAAAAVSFYVADKNISSLLARLQSVEVQPTSVAAGLPLTAQAQASQVAFAQTRTPVQADASSETPPWPAEASAREDASAAAHHAQFKQWNITLEEGASDPCGQALTQGLRCYAGIGNLGSLASHDRPAILTLMDNDGQPYHATLLSLNGELATLAFAHGNETVSVRDLEARWRGEYQLLWRSPPLGYSVIRPGSRGAHVTWLTKSLQAAGVTPLDVRNAYDDEVVAAVQAFQRRHGLVADGIAGRRTLIKLNSANDASIPRLKQRGDG